MAKLNVSQWDTTANNNTDVGGISLAENVMQPPAVNDAFREVMAQIASGVVVKIAATATVSAYFQLAEATNNGTNKLTITPATSLTADRTATFPDLSGTVSYVDAAQTISGVYTFSAIPVLSGGAITFPATQVPSANANTLDDYEEGTFTPAFSATGSTFSYASQVGIYTKIGNRVYVDIRIDLNTSGNTLAANPLSITGLPFTASASITNIKTSIYWSVSTTNYVKMGATLTGGGTTLAVGGNTVASGSDPGPAINASAALSATGGSSMNLHFCYFV